MTIIVGMRTKFLLFVSLLVASALCAQQPFAPAVIGTPGAPSTTLYGVYGGELVRSMDLGNTWAPLYVTQAGLPQPPIVGFAVDPTNPNTLYLATTLAAGAFWKSTDAGNTWAQAAAGLPTKGSLDFFNLLSDTTGAYEYVKISNQLFRSSNAAGIWVHVGNLPAPNGTLVIAPSQRSMMYYIDSTLLLWISSTEGVGWNSTTSTILNGAGAGDTVAAAAVAYWDPGTIYAALNVPGLGVISYADTGNGIWTDQSSKGLGPFTQILAANTGPTYALTNPYNGTFRSIDNGMSWQQSGIKGSQRFGATAVDPVLRTTLWGLQYNYPSSTPVTLAESTDSGNDWTPIPSTITPSIGAPAPMFNVTLEQGASYSTTFTVQTAESPVWATAVTLSTTGEPWLQIATGSGQTPLPDSITISTNGLLPGVYNSTITISAPQTFNKSVSVPVHLTVKPAGSLGPGYTVSTAAGNGNPAGGATSGVPPAVAVGGARAVAIDSSGKVDFSAGNRIWQLSGATTPAPSLSAIAGDGMNGSSGNGGNPLMASIANPDAIAFDASAGLYFTEYAFEDVRQLTGAGPQTPGNINTALDMTFFHQPVGSHDVVIDPTRFMLLAMPQGIVRFDGANFQTLFPYTFSNPYSMIEDSSGNLWVSDMALNQIFEVTPGGAVSVVAGTGLPGYGGDGGPATQAALNAPAGIAMDSQGTLYIADSGNNRIRTITPDGNIHTIAGNGLPGFDGDGLTADFASFLTPLGVAVDAKGNVYVADSGNNRLRMLSPQNTPTPQPRALNAIQGPNVATTLAPGGLFSIYGAQLAPSGYHQEVDTNTWPRSMGGVSVTINGVAAPLYYVSATQINGQIPFETATGTATAIITSNGSLPAQINFPVAAAQPDVLVQGGGTQAIAVNQDGSVNSSSTPAHPGDIEVVYLSGIGIPNPPVPTGAPSPSTPPLAVANYSYQITINGQQVPSSPYDFLGYAPGFPSLEQANFELPPGVTGNLSLVVTVNGVSSAPTIISVQ